MFTGILLRLGVMLSVGFMLLSIPNVYAGSKKNDKKTGSTGTSAGSTGGKPGGSTGSGTKAGSGAGSGAGSSTKAGAGSGTKVGSGAGAGAGSGPKVGAGTKTGAGSGTKAGSGAGAGAGSGTKVGAGAGAGAGGKSGGSTGTSGGSGGKKGKGKSTAPRVDPMDLAKCVTAKFLKRIPSNAALPAGTPDLPFSITVNGASTTTIVGKNMRDVLTALVSMPVTDQVKAAAITVLNYGLPLANPLITSPGVSKTIGEGVARFQIAKFIGKSQG